MNPRLALRALLKRPYVSAIGVISLAFGIGATTAIFSLYYQILLRPLPVREPAGLVNLSSPGPKAGARSCGEAGDCDSVFSYPLFRDLEAQQSVLKGLAGHVGFDVNLAADGVTRSGKGVLASGRYFELLGLQPALGRLLGPQDDGAPGASTAVVLSHDYWISQFAGNPDVVGRALTVNGKQLTIVGVAPEGFRGTNLLAKPDVFAPITLRATLQPLFDGTRVSVFENRFRHWIYVFGRLQPGASIAQAQQALNVPFRRVITDVEAPRINGFSAQTMEQFKARRLLLEDGQRGQSTAHKEARIPLNLLFVVAGLVLAIVCINLANLLLVQASDRSPEIAIRLAIGASRRQLIAQLLSESCLLAIAGGVGALLVSHWTLNAILYMFPEAINFIVVDAQSTILVFASLFTLVAGITFGIVPAVRTTRPTTLASIQARTTRVSGNRSTSRFRTVLATTQIGLSLMLLISAGLFTKSLMNLSRVDLGVNVNNVLVFGVSPGLSGYSPERSRAFFGQLEERLAELPGVSGATTARVSLIAGDNWHQNFSVEGFTGGTDIDRDASMNVVGLNFFSTVGMRFKAGRDFTAADTVGVRKVAIVNEEFARKFNLAPNPLGKRLKLGTGDGPLDIEIIGLVQNAKYSSVKDKVPPVLFQPYRQSEAGDMNFYVRSAQDTAALTSAIRSTVREMDPNLPIDNVMTFAQQVRETNAVDRLLTALSSAFALLATLIAGIGLYGVLAHSVTQRTREIGVRLAVGASAGQIRGMVLRQVGKMMLIGGVLGLIAAMALGRLVKSLLFELNVGDPLTIFAATTFLLIVVFTAGFIPAFRASRVHPIEALRYE